VKTRSFFSRNQKKLAHFLEKCILLTVFLEKWKLTTCFARKYVALRANEVIVQIGGTLVAVD